MVAHTMANGKTTKYKGSAFISGPMAGDMKALSKTARCQGRELTPGLMVEPI